MTSPHEFNYNVHYFVPKDELEIIIFVEYLYLLILCRKIAAEFPPSKFQSGSVIPYPICNHTLLPNTTSYLLCIFIRKQNLNLLNFFFQNICKNKNCPFRTYVGKKSMNYILSMLAFLKILPS